MTYQLCYILSHRFKGRFLFWIVLWLLCAGRVQRWHTPFGGLQTPEVHTERVPVFMNQDGSLVIPNSSALHSGLYYCLLQHTEGTALWPYDLRFDPELADSEQGSSCAALRERRSPAFAEEAQVSKSVFAGAVSASVVLTFVLGFSAGALNRNGVLRCLEFQILLHKNNIPTTFHLVSLI